MIDQVFPSLLLLAAAVEGPAGVVIGVLGFLVAFGLAVFVHELGHFLAAKAFGVPVERFVIGFDRDAMGFLPPCIVEFKIRETTYGLAVVPLGGYVKMVGTIHPEIEKYLDGDGKDAPAPAADATAPADAAKPYGETADPHSITGQAVGDMAALYKKPFWQKVIIYSAGVVMNLILAGIIVTILYTRGIYEDAPFKALVGWVAPDSAFSGRVQTGDRVVELNGVPIANSDAFFGEINKGLPDEKASMDYRMKVERPGNPTTEYVLEGKLSGAEPKAVADFVDTFIHRPAHIDAVVFNERADKAGIRANDLVLSINGEKINDWRQFVQRVRASAGKELQMEIQRGQEVVSVKVTPAESATEKGVGQIGVINGNKEKNFVQEPFMTAAAAAPGRVVSYTVRYARALGKLGGHIAEGNVGVLRRELGGPVAIAQASYRTARKGLSDWMQFVILLNVALAVMNMLPIPVLDGGHICFAAWEAIFRKPVPARFLVPAFNAAAICLIAFFVLVTFNDLFKIFL